jgi:hypothetical protein
MWAAERAEPSDHQVCPGDVFEAQEKRPSARRQILRDNLVDVEILFYGFLQGFSRRFRPKPSDG